MNDAPISGGPGIPAFLAFLFLVIALWLLMRNMNARLRRMSYRQRAEEDDAQEGGAHEDGARGKAPGEGPAEQGPQVPPGDEGAGGGSGRTGS